MTDDRPRTRNDGPERTEVQPGGLSAFEEAVARGASEALQELASEGGFPLLIVHSVLERGSAPDVADSWTSVPLPNQSDLAARVGSIAAGRSGRHEDLHEPSARSYDSPLPIPAFEHRGVRRLGKIRQPLYRVVSMSPSKVNQATFRYIAERNRQEQESAARVEIAAERVAAKRASLLEFLDQPDDLPHGI